MKRKIIIICIAVILTALTCIPIFAVTDVKYYYTTQPADLGTNRGYLNTSYALDTLNKYYVKITDLTTSGQAYVEYYNSSGNTSYTSLFWWTIDNNTITITKNNIENKNCITLIPTINQIDISNANEFYIPIFLYNAIVYTSTTTTNYEIWNSDIPSNIELQRQYYEMGYSQGYDTGFDEGLLEGQNIQQYTNLTGYVTQLLTQFVGTDAAPYVTPIAIVLVILFVYFLFIRFLLSLIKAKGVIKTCDIIMLVACIILLVVMYAPMLDLTIKNETITETTAIRTTKTEIWTEHTETGDIMYGPMGTVIIPNVETTTSEQEQTEVEVTSQRIVKENIYEEEKETTVNS